MIHMILTVLTAWTTPALAADLRARLERPTCDIYLAEVTDSVGQRNLLYRLFERAGHVFDGPGEVYVSIDDVADLFPTELTRREFRVERALIELSLATPNEFASLPLLPIEWRLAVYRMDDQRPRHEAVLVGDRLTFDPDRLRVTGGEFVVEIPYGEELTPAMAENVVRWAFERTHLPTSRLKGFRSPHAGYPTGVLYVLLDLSGDPEYRYAETLRLMKYVNEELAGQ